MARKPKTDGLTARILRYSDRPERNGIHQRVFLHEDGTFTATNQHIALRLRDGLEAERVKARLGSYPVLVRDGDAWIPSGDTHDYGSKIRKLFPETLDGYLTGTLQVPEWFGRLKAHTERAYVGLTIRENEPVRISITDSPGTDRVFQIPYLADFAGQTVRVFSKPDALGALVVLPADGCGLSDAPWIALVMPARHDPDVLPEPGDLVRTEKS